MGRRRRPSLNKPPVGEIEELLEAARGARERAYAPYSEFRVGAAVLTDEGAIIPGANMENASYPLSMCAERNAVGRAVSEGARKLLAIAVVGSSKGYTWPCGGCRQVLHEFGPDLLVISEAPDGSREERRLPELLPDAFGPENLG